MHAQGGLCIYPWLPFILSVTLYLFPHPDTLMLWGPIIWPHKNGHTVSKITKDPTYVEKQTHTFRFEDGCFVSSRWFCLSCALGMSSSSVCSMFSITSRNLQVRCSSSFLSSYPESAGFSFALTRCLPAWLYWLLALCGVICLLKSAISLLHLVTASQNMAALDIAEREKSTKAQWERSKLELQEQRLSVHCFVSHYLYDDAI